MTKNMLCSTDLSGNLQKALALEYLKGMKRKIRMRYLKTLLY